MIETSRIQSGFDAELLLGGKWFLTAIHALNENDAIDIPDGITINDITVNNDPDWDLDLITNFGPVKARLTIEDNQFRLVTNIGDIDFKIDMPNFGQLADTPVLNKVFGNDDYENAMALLFNLDIRACPQDQEPKPTGEHYPRGNADDAVSFLPNGQHVALGIARESFKRFANNIWHTELRDVDGSHPLPMPGEEKKGDWKKVKVSVNKKRIKFTLEGEVPIDFWPDADVSLEIELKPRLVKGKLTFSIDTDLDVDTGFWGDLLAFTIGALLGLLIGFLTGGLLILVPALGLRAVIVLEVGEFIAGEVIERRILAKDEDGNIISGLSCDEKIVKLTHPEPSDDSISIGVLDTIPTSIPVHIDEDDPLFNRMITVKAIFDEIELEGDGLAVAGKTEASELFQINVARIEESIYAGDELKQLKYKIPGDNNEILVDVEDIYERLNSNELQPPLKLSSHIENPIYQIPSGKLCCACLQPTHIRRKDTVITRIKFDTGLELNTQDAVNLQDSGGIYLKGLQLIHPKDGKPYFRAPANDSTDDNLESLPEF
ncbi:MAG: DUF3892 domain-containing protein [Bacteroidales bacterium]|nr:DUF3892 domain-containing protein [Bacteroidales bacterium]